MRMHPIYLCMHLPSVYLGTQSPLAEGHCCRPQLPAGSCQVCELHNSWNSAWTSVGAIWSMFLGRWQLVGGPKFNTGLRLVWGLFFPCRVSFPGHL